MKILLVSLLKRRLSPTMTASRPRVIFDLAQGLVKAGHQVSILAPKTSVVPGAKIIPVIPKDVVSYPTFENPFYAETGFLVRLAKTLTQVGNRFDIIHNHTYPEFINLLVEPQLTTPMVTTVHAQMTQEMDETLSYFKGSKLIALSQSAKSLAIKSKMWRVVYNGVDTSLYAFHEHKDEYLLWLGRLGKAKDKHGNFMDAKGVRAAIRVAQLSGQRLLLSGNVEDKDFFDRDVKPHLGKQIEWVGGVGSEQPLGKNEVVKLMQRAQAFLMPVQWAEPFGLVMAEAMSCGTPVIGFRRGAVPELVKHGQTGFVVSTVAQMVAAVKKVDLISPQACRDHVVKNFSLERTVQNYLAAYRDAIEQR